MRTDKPATYTVRTYAAEQLSMTARRLDALAAIRYANTFVEAHPLGAAHITKTRTQHGIYIVRPTDREKIAATLVVQSDAAITAKQIEGLESTAFRRNRARRKPTTLPLGTISEATLQPEDLISAYLDALDAIRLTRAERAVVNNIRSCPREPFDDVDELTAILESHCPDYSYFGSTEGDGACFGVWPTIPEESDGDVYRCSMTPSEMRLAAARGEANGVFYSPAQRQSLNRTYRAMQRQSTHWLYVNDHGNVTLYRRAGNRWIEVWSVV